MRISYTYIICLLFILNIHFSYGQKLNRQEMVADINYYFDILRNKHPNLYKKFTPMQFDSLQQKLIGEVIDSMDCMEFNRLLLRINSFTDGHTQVLTNKIWGSIHEKDSLPYFRVKKDSLFLYDDLVLSINGQDIGCVVKEISNTLSWEYNPLLKEKHINFYLPFFLSTFYDVHSPYLINLIDVNTNVTKLDTVKIKKLLHIANYKERFNFEFFDKESIAVFHYNSCQIGSDIKLFQQALSAAFEKMEKDNIKYLFIDVTKNGGGSTDNNSFIFDYLKTKKCKVKKIYRMNKLSVKSYIEDARKSNREYIDEAGKTFWKRLILKYKVWKVERVIPSLLKTGVYVGKETYPRNRKGFSGSVFVLQGRETYSAAISFVSDFRRRKAGIVVGEIAGAPVDFCGNMRNDTLPSSKIAVVYPFDEIIDSPAIETDVNGFLVPDIPYDVFNKDLTIEDYKEIIRLSNNLK